MATASKHRKTSARFHKRALTAAIGVAAAVLVVALPYWSIANGRDKDQSSTPETAPSLKGLPISGLTENEAILHALNRLGYGPRPGDVGRVKQMGLSRWIDQQLHPESMDESAVNARLANFPTLTMSSGKLLNEFPRPQVAAKREGVTLQEYQE